MAEPSALLAVTSRVVCAVLGVVLIFVSLCLYEDEERRIQDRLELFWARVDDLRKSSGSLVLSFLATAGGGVGVLLALAIGLREEEDLSEFPAQIFTACACYSIGSLSLPIAVAVAWFGSAEDRPLLAFCLVWSVSFFFVGLLSAHSAAVTRVSRWLAILSLLFVA